MKTARLLYASTESNADALYFAKFFVPDAFIAIELDGKKIGVMSMLEISRAQKDSDFDAILSLEELQGEAKKAFRKERPGVVEIVRLLAKELKITTYEIPRDFPASIAFALKKARLKIEVIEGAFFPGRETKTKAEADAIKAGNAASAAGIRAAEKTLAASTVKKGKLYFNGKILTSEILRTKIDIACLEVGAVASHTICAGGDQACDPHCAGYGPLRPNELIIVDVFPRVTATGYHGDMTRTFLKGKASPEQKRLVKTVQAAQKAALKTIKARVDACKAHDVVKATFKVAGYTTEKINDVWQGFFHGTGHGLGLEVHEAPRVSTAKERLKSGAVITVEPGLYYPGLGGCRIEDVVQVKAGGYDMLSKYHYRWEIK